MTRTLENNFEKTKCLQWIKVFSHRKKLRKKRQTWQEKCRSLLNISKGLSCFKTKWFLSIALYRKSSVKKMPERQGTESTLNKNGRSNFRNGPKWLLFRRLAGKSNFVAGVSFYKHRMGVWSLAGRWWWWWSCFRLFLFTPPRMCVARSIKSCVEFWSPDIPLDIPPQSTFHCLYNNIFVNICFDIC